MNKAIVYITNLEYLNLFKISLYSLITHNNVLCPVVVFYDTKKTLEELKKIKNKLKNINFIFKKLKLKSYEKLNFFNKNRDWALSPATRFEIFNLKYDKILYLDCDTLIVDNIEDIFNNKGSFVACKLNTTISHKYAQQNGFNAGVLLIGKKFLKTTVYKKLIKFTYLNKNISGNQIILNSFFSKHVNFISQIYNVTSDLLTEKLLNEGKIFHFIGDKKPLNNLQDSFNEYVCQNTGLAILSRLYLKYSLYKNKAYCFFSSAG